MADRLVRHPDDRYRDLLKRFQEALGRGASRLALDISVLGYTYILAGRASDALPLLEQYVSTEAMQRMRGRVHVWLSEAYLCLGRRDEALAVAVRGLELCRMHAQQGDHAWALRLLGEIYARRYPPQAEPAEAAYREALALAEELGMRPLVAHCHLGLGTLYATTGQPQQARAALSTAVEMYRAMDMPFWLPQTEAALAQLSQEETPAAWGRAARPVMRRRGRPYVCTNLRKHLQRLGVKPIWVYFRSRYAPDGRLPG